MLVITWEQIFETVRWWGGIFIVVFGAYKGWREYLATDLAKAKEKSVGATALKELEKDIDELESEIERLKSNDANYEVLKSLVESLREDYKFILQSLLPASGVPAKPSYKRHT